MSNQTIEHGWPWSRRLLWLAVCGWVMWFQGPTFLEALTAHTGWGEGDSISEKLSLARVRKTTIIRDFFQEWASAKNAFNDLPIYTSLDRTGECYLGWKPNPDEKLYITVNAHPPTSVLLAVPFCGLDYWNALLLWNVISLACLGLSGWIIVRQLRIDWSGWALLPVFTLLIVCNPLQQQLIQGQLNLILLLMLTGTWACARSGYSGWAGTLLGFATAVKLFPGFLFLYFLLRKDWRALICGGLSFLAVTAVTVGVLGSEAYLTYIRDVLPTVAEFRCGWINASLVGFWSKLFQGSVSERVLPLFENPVLATAAIWLTAAAVVAILSWTVRRQAHAQGDLEFSLSMLAMLLVSPITWDHYFLLLLVPIAVLWRTIPASGAARWVFWGCLALLWIAPQVFWLALMGVHAQDRLSYWAGPLETVTALSWHTYALLTLFALTVQWSWRTGISRSERIGERDGFGELQPHTAESTAAG